MAHFLQEATPAVGVLKGEDGVLTEHPVQRHPEYKCWGSALAPWRWRHHLLSECKLSDLPLGG